MGFIEGFFNIGVGGVTRSPTSVLTGIGEVGAASLDSTLGVLDRLDKKLSNAKTWDNIEKPLKKTPVKIWGDSTVKPKVDDEKQNMIKRLNDTSRIIDEQKTKLNKVTKDVDDLYTDIYT